MFLTPILSFNSSFAARLARDYRTILHFGSVA